MTRQRLTLMTGAVLGLVGGLLVLAYVRGVESRAEAGERRAIVYFATRTIPSGTPAAELTGMLRRTEMPARYTLPGTVQSLEQVRDRVTSARIDRGMPLLRSAFAAAGGPAGGRLAVPEGREAISITVGLQSGVARFPRPGDRVSAYATFRGARPTAVKLLSNVVVLQTEPGDAQQKDAGLGSRARAEHVYTLAVTPAEAARVALAGTTGSIWLTLVPPGQRSGPVAPLVLDPLRLSAKGA